MAKIRTCIVDEKQYEYCPKCGRDSAEEKWRFLYCCEECKNINSIVTNYKNGKLDIADANEQLMSMNVKGKRFSNNVWETMKNIMDYKTKKKKNKISVDIVEDIVPVVQEEIVPDTTIVNDIITEENTMELEPIAFINDLDSI